MECSVICSHALRGATCKAYRVATELLEREAAEQRIRDAAPDFPDDPRVRRGPSSGTSW